MVWEDSHSLGPAIANSNTRSSNTDVGADHGGSDVEGALVRARHPLAVDADQPLDALGQLFSVKVLQ